MIANGWENVTGGGQEYGLLNKKRHLYKNVLNTVCAGFSLEGRKIK
jgi:hypothetical protein